MKTEPTPQLLKPLEAGLELLRTPEPPYYAAITNNIQLIEEVDSYDKAMQKMLDLVKTFPGFLGSETASEKLPDGRFLKVGVTYWKTLEALDAWRKHSAHKKVKSRAKSLWYAEHNTRVCQVLEQYGSNLTQGKTTKLAYLDFKQQQLTSTLIAENMT